MDLLEAEIDEKLNRLAPVDVIGTEAFTAWHSERRVLRRVCALLGGLLALSATGNVILSLRAPKIVWIRVDDVRGAQVVQYSSLQFTPTEGVVRKSLDDFAKLWFPRLRSTVLKTHNQGYYFIDSMLASRIQQNDTRSNEIPMVAAGRLPEYDAVMQLVQITSLDKASLNGTIVWRGTAQIAYERIYPASNASQERREQWVANLSFVVNPEQVAEQSQKNPDYQFLNPLGVSLTDLHEAQVIH